MPQKIKPLTGEALAIRRGLMHPDLQARLTAANRWSSMHNRYKKVAGLIIEGLALPGLEFDQSGRLVAASSINQQNTAVDRHELKSVGSLADAAPLIAVVHDKITFNRDCFDRRVVLHHGRQLGRGNIHNSWNRAPGPDGRVDIMLQTTSIDSGIVENIKHVGAFAASFAMVDSRAQAVTKHILETTNQQHRRKMWQEVEADDSLTFRLATIEPENTADKPLPALARTWLAALMVESHVGIGNRTEGDATVHPSYMSRTVKLRPTTYFAIDPEIAKLWANGVDFTVEPIILGSDASEQAETEIQDGIVLNMSDTLLPAITQFGIEQHFTPE